MIKKTLAFSFALAMLLALAPVAPSIAVVEVSDTPSTWAEPDVERAINLELVPIDMQSEYTSPTTRAEFAALAVILYEKELGTITGRTTFTDTDDASVQKAAYIGVVQGVGNGRFDPDGPLTREMAATLMSNLSDAMGQPFPQGAPTFDDNDSMEPWARAGIGRAQAAGLMAGTGNNLFSPKDVYERQQSIVATVNMYDIVAGISSDPTFITTGLGVVRGAYDTAYDGTEVLAFKGIPYATVPARFAVSEPATASYRGVYDATEFRQVPYQNIASGTLALLYAEYESTGMTADEIESVMVSETDCLNLNIWTTETDGSKPVFVWIHGGGWTVGSNRSVTSQLMSVAEEGIVCVSIGYRLGAMGWAAFDSDSPNTGNLGLLDLVCGLQWIQDNIADYGGDPAQVTIGGQSAGSYNVADLVRSPLAEGLFSRAIMQSGSDFSTSPERVISGTTAFAADYAGLENIASSEAKEIMEAVPALDLTVAWVTNPLAVTRSTADGYVLPVDGFTEVINNNINQVDLLVGSVRDEHTLIRPGVNDLAGLDRYLTGIFGADKIDEVKSYFGVTSATTDEEAVAIANHLGDLTFIWNGYIYADNLVASNNVWCYRYDYAAPAFFIPGVGPLPGMGVAHGSEINMIFKANIDDIGLDEDGYALSDNMTAAWVNFIKTGDPNGSTTELAFTPYDKDDRQVTHIDIDGTTATEVPYIDDITFILQTLYGYHF